MSRTAAIYARFSTDLQNERSVEDQLALCRDYAAREGIEIVAAFSDAARSGASIFGRDGLLQLLALTERDLCPIDTVIVEHADRLSRDMEDLAGIHKRLNFRRIEIRAVHSGTMDTASVGLFALVGQMQREEGAKKVRRGMTGVVRSGRSAGGRLYGYRPVPGQPGQLEIVEEERAIVLRIFTEYADGLTPREIAGRLNRDGIAPPRGRRWAASTINGNTRRGNGLLQTELYGGTRVWNKVAMVRNPANGRRVSRPNPPEQWISMPAPEMAIAPPALFAAVRARKGIRSAAPRQHTRKPRHLLSGLLRCACGAGMGSKGKDRTGRVRVECSAHRESGTCAGGVFYLDRVEEKVLGLLRAELRDPVVMAEFVRAYHTERARLASGRVRDRSRIERRAQELAREQKRVIDLMMATDDDVPDLIARSKEIAAEQRQVAQDLEAAPAPPPAIVALHPASLVRYEALLTRLQDALARGMAVGDAEAAAALRDLVETVTLRREDGELRIEIAGRLNALLLGPAAFPHGIGGNGGSGGPLHPTPPMIFRIAA